MVPAAPNHQAIQQFLSSVLSQRGPSALPYTEDTKWLIRQHLLSLTSTFPSLEPKTATFTHNDGRTVNLLQADGTVPMTFESVTYNIPNWIYPSSNLVDLARELSLIFGRDPPLFSQRPRPSPNPVYHPNQSSLTNSSTSGSVGSGYPRPMVRPPQYPAPSPPYGGGVGKVGNGGCGGGL
ncbi:hypothetical protein OIU84_023586 [Salix udensis]|uniref:UEV domain-containing protein n=1 Tax=Salix udensis TaxID=889485 RepID=A0AAD6KTK7_9ROSI|nr:hypothetical protein OIU84_023586 [Salix udensis]